MRTKLVIYFLVTVMLGGIGGYLIGGLRLDASAPQLKTGLDQKEEFSDYLLEIERSELVGDLAYEFKSLPMIDAPSKAVSDLILGLSYIQIDWATAIYYNCINKYIQNNPPPSDPDEYERWSEMAIKNCLSLIVRPFGESTDSWTDWQWNTFFECLVRELERADPPITMGQAIRICLYGKSDI